MNFKLILFYLVGSIILYLEPISIGGLTFGIIWKLILMFILFLPVLYKTVTTEQIEMFAFISIIFAFKTLISYSSMDYIVNTLTIFIKALMFPLLYLYFSSKFKQSTLIYIAKHLSILTILIFIPYFLGFLEPLSHGYDLAAYGLDGQYGLIGPFIQPHTASISISFAMIIITLHIKKINSKKINLFYVALLLLGFYELLGTYVRTGLAIYLLVLLYMYLQEINLKRILMILLASALLGAGALYLIATNEIVQMRFEERNKYSNDGEIGSGRVTYWKTAVNSWLNDDPSVIFIGLGEEYAKDKMEAVTGMRIFAHNEFFQMLQQEGLIGLALFLWSLFLIHRFIAKHKYSKHYLPTKIIFVGMILEMMLQGGFYFNMVLLLSIYLSLLKIDDREKVLKNNNTLQKKRFYV